MTKILTKEYYRVNAGFFLLVATLTFGFMSGVEHIALAQSFVSSPYLLLIPFGVWVLYSLKILNFNSQQLRRSENQILFNIAFLSITEQVFAIGFTIMLQFLPAIIYGVFLAKTALSLNVYDHLLYITAVLIVLWSGCTLILIKKLQSPLREKQIGFLKRYTDYQFTKSIVRIYVEWLCRRDPLMVAGTKMFSALLLFGVCVLYESEQYDGRLMAMAMTAVAMANIRILFQIQDLENNQVIWMKNLPVTPMKRFAWVITVMAILLLPETVVLLRNFPEHLPAYLLIISLLYGLSLAACFYALLHLKASSAENFTRKCFVIFISLILLILFKIPLIFLALMIFVTSLLVYSKFYYVFEPGSKGIN